VPRDASRASGGPVTTAPCRGWMGCRWCTWQRAPGPPRPTDGSAGTRHGRPRAVPSPNRAGGRPWSVGVASLRRLHAHRLRGVRHS